MPSIVNPIEFKIADNIKLSFYEDLASSLFNISKKNKEITKINISKILKKYDINSSFDNIIIDFLSNNKIWKKSNDWWIILKKNYLKEDLLSNFLYNDFLTNKHISVNLVQTQPDDTQIKSIIEEKEEIKEEDNAKINIVDAKIETFKSLEESSIEMISTNELKDDKFIDLVSFFWQNNTNNIEEESFSFNTKIADKNITNNKIEETIEHNNISPALNEIQENKESLSEILSEEELNKKFEELISLQTISVEDEENSQIDDFSFNSSFSDSFDTKFEEKELDELQTFQESDCEQIESSDIILTENKNLEIDYSFSEPEKEDKDENTFNFQENIPEKENNIEQIELSKPEKTIDFENTDFDFQGEIINTDIKLNKFEEEKKIDKIETEEEPITQEIIEKVYQEEKDLFQDQFEIEETNDIWQEKSDSVINIQNQNLWDLNTFLENSPMKQPSLIQSEEIDSFFEDDNQTSINQDIDEQIDYPENNLLKQEELLEKKKKNQQFIMTLLYTVWWIIIVFIIWVVFLL